MASLHEMRIGVEGVPDAQFPHHLRGKAVREGPFLVGTTAIEGYATNEHGQGAISEKVTVTVAQDGTSIRAPGRNCGARSYPAMKRWGIPCRPAG